MEFTIRVSIFHRNDSGCSDRLTIVLFVICSKLRNMDFKNQQNQGHRLYQMNLFMEELHLLVSPMEKVCKPIGT